MSKIIKITAFFLFFVMCFCIKNTSAQVLQVQNCTPGDTQEKYTATADCKYKTETRTCCSNKTWSGWGAACSNSCSASTKPAFWEECTVYGWESGAKGERTRTVTCNTSNYTWTTGTWSACQCVTTCDSGYVLDKESCRCCRIGCYNNSSTFCNCTNIYYDPEKEQCRMSDGNTYEMVPGYNDCEELAEAMGLSVSGWY